MRKLKGHKMTSMILLAAGLLAGCSVSDDETGESEKEILLNADVWRVMEGTRATTYDNIGAVQEEGFAVYAFVDGEGTQYISGSTVSHVASQWTFDDGKHYWPVTGGLNFFAHVPKNLSSTSCSFDPTPYDAETNIDGYSEDCPRIICTNLPMTSSGQSTLNELVYAYVPAQTKAANASGVTLTFKRPFARIRFQLAASHPNITINSITFKGLKTGGTCTFNGTSSTWSSLTPADKTVDFVATINQECHDNPASAVSLGDSYLVVPQTFDGNITVNASWTDWGEDLDHTVSTTLESAVAWEPGSSYTYTFTITPRDLRVNTSKFTEQW